MKGILATLALAGTLAAAGGCQTASTARAPEFQLAVTDQGFEPAETVIPKGRAATIVVTRKTDATCAKEIVIEKLNEKRDLPLNQPVRIEIPKEAAQDTLSYVCGMDMLGGTIVAK
jgi:plastocyanin domain-containing protein